MPLASLYNAVKRENVKVRTIQEVIQQNPEKKNMFVNSDVVLGKNFVPGETSFRSNSTSVTGIAQGLKASSSNGLPLIAGEEKIWSKCKCLKENSGLFFCKKFQMKCVQDKCPKKFIEN